ncbi:MAG: non-homologous end-joining DNA ligase [Actinomycetota bacterium]|nr:non-homologous end-joining DNA ligase [Actinomycetota bacterium]
MLATPWDAPFVDDDWLFELKWDGIRCLLSSQHGDVSLHSRNGNDLTGRYPELAELEIAGGFVLDGEIVALDEKGHPSFELLQGRMNLEQPGSLSRAVPISYVVFDMLHDGESLVNSPLLERSERLATMRLPGPVIVGDQFGGDSRPIWDFVIEHSLEGIVAKRITSRYQPGVRSPDWRKIANFKQVRAVVGGYTVGTGGRASTFGALLLGLWTEDRLRWIGSVGSGFDDKALRAIREALDEMVLPTSPFGVDDDIPRGSTFVEPRLVATIQCKQWTAAGRLRAPSFKGFSDLPAGAATWGSEGPVHSSDGS